MTKITEETRIKDLIPEGWEIESYEQVAFKMRMEEYRDQKYLMIPIEPNHKTLWDYRDEYEDEVYQGALDVYPSRWNSAEKLDLLWHMIKDKGGDLGDYSYLIWRITKVNDGYLPTPASDIADKVWQLLPQPFINSFHED